MLSAWARCRSGFRVEFLGAEHQREQCRVLEPEVHVRAPEIAEVRFSGTPDCPQLLRQVREPLRRDRRQQTGPVAKEVLRRRMRHLCPTGDATETHTRQPALCEFSSRRLDESVTGSSRSGSGSHATSARGPDRRLSVPTARR